MGRSSQEPRLSVFAAVVLLGCACLLPQVSGHELCTDGAGPKTRTNFTLPYCGTSTNVPYNSKGCCDLTADSAARNTVATYGIVASTDPGSLCLIAMKLIACSKCDPWSAHLWDSEGSSSATRGSPWLCSIVANTDFGPKIWNNCSNVSFASNPFTGLPGKISDVYTRTSFFAAYCKSVAPAYCYNGRPYSPTAVGGVGTVDPNSPIACLDRISSSGFIGMIKMPRTLTGVDTRRALGWTQTGRVTLMGLPPPRLNASSPAKNATIITNQFLLLASRVIYDQAERGLLGVALHPGFNTNGRFFVSYACNSTKFPDCAAPCQCPLDPVCKANAALNASCDSVLLVAEYKASATGTGGDYALTTLALSTEVRKVLKFGRTWDQHNGGQILFKPGDTGSYLYYFSGDGQPTADTVSNYAQNPLMFQGKILRIDVDNLPPNKTYGIPPGNPFVGDPGKAAPELWALGLRNPWSNSFDALTGRLFTGDVGYNSREEVDLIEPGNNYGWKYYEGTNVIKTLPASGVYGQLTSPLFEYTHSGLPSADASITGGVVWRSKLTNPCMWGRYMFNNYRALPFWLGTVNPVFGSPYSTEQLRVACWSKTTNVCPVITGAASTYFTGYMEDNDNEVYVMGFSGIFRLVDTSFCGKPCLTNITVELARQLASTMSSVAAGSPALAVDGMFGQDLGSCAVSLNSTAPWWSVDLDVTANVTSVKLWVPTGSAGTWITPAVVTVSNSPPSTPNRVTTVCPSAGVSATTGTLSAACGGAVGRYVSVTLPGRFRTLALCEVQVYGRALRRPAI